jgi:hypothetical protein
MNIFCHPKFSSWIGPQQLLQIDKNEPIIFWWNPLFSNEDIKHPTEIDMKIGNRIFESKLTEDSFTEKDLSVVETYRNIWWFS